MQVRFGLAVVTGAGSDVGREVAVRLARAGAAVLCVDTDVVAADETARLVEAARTRAWSLQADVATEEDVVVLAARAHDLGGADMLVDATGSGPEVVARLARCFVDGLAQRRGRAEPGALVVLGAEPPTTGDADARSMAVRVRGEVAGAAVATAVLRLLTAGADGEVVDLRA